MALKTSVAIRNAMLNAIETAIGVSPIMKIRTGAPPADETEPDAGTVVATLALPSDWLLNAADGVKEKSGTWEDASADADGIAGHYRVYAADGVTCHLQGTVTLTGAGGDLEVDNTNFKATQVFTVTNYSLEMPNG